MTDTTHRAFAAHWSPARDAEDVPGQDQDQGRDSDRDAVADAIAEFLK